MIARLFSLVLVVFALGGCAEPPYTNVDNEQLKALLVKGVPLYDIRRADEWRQTGVVDSSRKLTFVDESGRMNPELLPRLTSEVGKNEPVILICRTGNRTDALARHLVEKLGYTQVYNVKNGITSWVNEGNPVTRL